MTSPLDITKMEKFQGGMIKNVMGVSKRSHHTSLLHAMDIHSIQEVLEKKSLTLYNKIFRYSSPARDLNMSEYFVHSRRYPGTLLDKIVSFGYSPAECAFAKRCNKYKYKSVKDGVVDSLKTLIYTENFVKSWSSEHILTTLLLKAF